MRLHPARSALALLVGALLPLLSCSEVATAPKSRVVAGPNRLASASASLVISQIYGGGGNANAQYKNDFIELFNRGSVPVSLKGMSVQYASATGTSNFGVTNQITLLPDVTLEAGQYFLIQEAGGTTGINLPTPDFVQVTAAINMSGTGGKVVLANTTASLGCNGGSAICSAAQRALIVDLIGYDGANFFEGGSAAPTLSNTTAALRGNAGCVDTDNNGADFTAAAPAPRNTASTRKFCDPPVFTSIRFNNQSISLGGTLTLKATALDQFSQPMNPQPVMSWSSANDDVVHVDPNTGAATGKELGSATVTVGSGAISKTAQVSVVNVPHLMITELYGNPLGQDTQGEWMEVYNGESTPVDISGYALKSNGSSPEDHVIDVSTPLSIPAGACIVLGNNANTSTNGGVPVAYSYAGSIILNNNNTDWFTIKTPDGALVDSVAYAIRSDDVTPSSFTPFADDGFSWELAFLSLDNTTVEGGNWFKSTHVFNANVKGTPGTCPPAAQVLTSVAVTTTSVNNGGTKQLEAKALDQNGNPMFTQPASFTWSVVDPSVLTVDPSTGMAEGKKLGSTTVSAASNGIFGSATITVVDPNAVGSLSISGGAISTLPAGYVSPHFPTAKRADGTTITPTPPLTWQVSDPGVASIDELGYLTAIKPGPVTVTAKAASGVVSNTWNYTITEHTVPTNAVYRGNLAFGQPTPGGTDNDRIIDKPQFTISYNPTRGGPNWVSFDLNSTHFGPTPRCNCFSPDPDLPNTVYHVVDFDYRNGGFDRGHMTMSEERTATLQENAVSFLLTNVVPQAHDNNAGPWEKFEIYLNGVAQSGKEVYVIDGGIYDASPHYLKNEGKVAIPKSTWKVALILNAGTGLADVHSLADVQAIAINTPNVTADGFTPITARSATNPDGIGPTWQEYETTVDAIEAATGYDFLANLDDEIEIPLEARDQPPVARVNGPATANEGSAVTFDATTSTDPDAGDVLHYAWDFGDGTTTATAGAQPTHTFADNGTYTVTVTAYDQVGAFNRASLTVTVANLAPSATFSPVATTPEGSPFTLSLAGATDASAIDAAALTFAFDCGDGRGYSSPSSTPGTLCATSDNGERPVRATVMDKDGAFAEYTGAVQVTNVAPTAAFHAPASVNEGDAFDLSLSSIFDPSSADVSAGLSIAFDCGNGYGAAGTSTSATCPTSNDGTRLARASITDKDGGVTEYALNVAVLNVAPVIAAFDGASLIENETYHTAGSFTDPGADVWSATVDYGDGTPSAALALSGRAFQLSHVYRSAGSFTVTVTVGDGTATPTRTAAVVVVTPASVLQAVLGQVDALPLHSNSLHAHLDNAIRELGRSKTTQAIQQLRQALADLDTRETQDALPAAQVDAIRVAIQRVLSSMLGQMP